MTAASTAGTTPHDNLVCLHTLLRAIPDLIWLKDRSGIFLACNAAFEQLLGASEADIVGKTDDDFFDKALADSFRQHDRMALAAGRPVRNEEVLAFADGSYQGVFETVKAPVLQSTGEVLGVLGIARDISVRKRYEETLCDFAFHDPLTQLPNRRLCLDRLTKALHTCRRQGSYGAVIFLDLNRFKPLNDRFGHQAGDLLLIEVARRLRASLRESDTVARLGGDEFVVLLEGLGTQLQPATAYAQQVTAKIEAALAQDYLLGSVRYPCSASVGLCVFSGDAADAGKVIRDADTAMYQAKTARRSNPLP